MKIGIIGGGKIGSVLAKHWIKGGHEVFISSRHPENLKPLTESLGPNAKSGSPEEASSFGEIILLSIPLGEIPRLSKVVRENIQGKIIIDATNPYPERDGVAGVEALSEITGSGCWVARNLPKAKIVKAFNTVYYKTLEAEAFRKENLIGIPLASDDENALQRVKELVIQTGFGPYIVGDLRRAKEFDSGTLPYNSNATVEDLKKIFTPQVTVKK